jgi:hypothetical protein
MRQKCIGGGGEDDEIRALLDGEVEAKLAIDRSENAVSGDLKVISKTK